MAILSTGPLMFNSLYYCLHFFFSSLLRPSSPLFLFTLSCLELLNLGDIWVLLWLDIMSLLWYYVFIYSLTTILILFFESF
jgi:hypothetical protein